MNVARLTIGFRLRGCASLKDKRRRLAKLRDKFGRQTGLAVCESDYADDLRRSEWGFVACASDARIVEQTLAEVERYVALAVDGEVVSMQRTWLN